MSTRPLTGKNIEELLANIAASDRIGDGAARQLAVELRDFMQSRERREEALRAVVRTAADIINVLNVSDVFDAAVARAQALVRSDIAYLAVFDEATGRTCVRASIGVKSRQFNQLNVPVGVGIGGVVARSKEPFLTADYISDTNLLHLASVDEGIAAEGIRAMAGVPLIAREEFTGALFISDRYVRSYTPEEVNDLQALGVLVTVAIENAKLFEAKEKGLREIQAAYDTLRVRTATTERIAGMHDQFATIVSRGAPYSELVSRLAEELNVDLILRDAAGQVLASHFHDVAMPPQMTLTGPRVEAALKRSIKSGMLELLPGVSEESESLILAIAVGNELNGSLAIFARRVLLGSERRTLERGGHVAGLLLLQGELAMSRDLQRRGQLLDDCIAGGQKWRDLRERGNSMEFDIEQPVLVATFDARLVESAELLRKLAQSVIPEKILLGNVRGNVVAFLPDYDFVKLTALAKKISDSLAMPVSVGFEHCDEPVSMGAVAADDAIRALQIVLALGKHGKIASLASLGEAVLLKGNSPAELSAYIDDTLGILQRYDLERASELVATLRQYFLSNQNVSSAASALKIHVKTMSQRLERITQLLGDDWRNSRRLLQIQLAIRLNELMHNSTCNSSE